MILIVSSFSGAKTCVSAVSKATGHKTSFVSTARALSSALQNNEFRLIVIDQIFADNNPDALNMVWKDCGLAMPVFTNFAIHSADRIAASCSAALLRQDRERKNAFRHAGVALKAELTTSVTGILLSSELALSDPELPEGLRAKLESVHDLALQLKCRIEMAA